MSLQDLAPPTIEGYTAWVYSVMGVPDNVLPEDSIYIQMSYDIAFEIVNRYIWCANPGVFTVAVYNLAGDYLVNIAQDDPNAVPPPDNATTYWADLRGSLNLNSFVPGLVNNAADQGTSAGLQLLKSMENLTLGDLQTLKTPWGRIYMGIAQSVGSMWGWTP
jgi:hypothetical protein